MLALLEANSISGTAKAVLEMAYEARADGKGPNGIEICVANFARGAGDVDNALTKALTTAEIPFSFIREKGRFDGSVISQIRNLAAKYEAGLIWSNSVKSHFLVKQAKMAKSCRWVAFHHGYTSTDVKMRLYNELDRFSLRHADRVLTVCVPFAKQMKARGVTADRIRVQHMPIRRFTTSSEEVAALRKELGLDVASKIILTIGRLSKEKGHQDLISAYAELRKQSSERLRLVIVGDGPERKRLEELADGNVLFTGHRDDAKRFYSVADVFALPSYSEGTPNVLLEAMAARVPVVASRVGGIPELATDGKHALLVPPANVAELAKALKRLLSEPALRKDLVDVADGVVSAHTPRMYFEGMRRVFLEATAS